MGLMRLLPAIFVALISTITVANASPEERQADVEAFVGEMITKYGAKYGFEHDALMSLMYQAQFRKDIIKAIDRPAEAKPWYQYREIFLTPARINGGVKFWRANEALLDKVAQEYGVPPEMIVAILGIETRYGKITGTYRVIDALTTLAFGYPKRAPFFRNELEELLLLDHEEGLNFITRTSSYAGAMGMPQFMPSSYRAFAVDEDGNGKRDLWNSNADIVASVANYFRNHGWHTGEPVIFRARVTNPPPKEFLDPGNLPTIPIDKLTAAGIVTSPPLPKEQNTANPMLTSLIRLDGNAGDEYWVGLNNFYVITRYNHSNLYALAAYQLSQEILNLHNGAENFK